MANTIKPIVQQTETTVQSTVSSRSVGSFNKALDKSPNDGIGDKFNEVRFRLAVIDNPEIQRTGDIDPTDIKHIINVNNGQVTLRWLDMPGGVIRPKELDGEWYYNKEKDKPEPELRKSANIEWDIKSQREMVTLATPFIWTGLNTWTKEKTYCGFNYTPPVGSIVIIGFRKHGFPMIMGYLPEDWKLLEPTLHPGETLIKGFGRNYIHWRWSDKLDHKTESKFEEIDIDYPDRRLGIDKKVNPTNCFLWIRMDANHRRIELSAYENHPKYLPANKYDTAAENPQHETHKTTIFLRPKKLIMHSEEILDGLSPTHVQRRYTEYYQDEVMIKTTAENPLKQWKTVREQQAYFVDQTADDFKTAEHTDIYQDPFNIKHIALRPGQLSKRHQMPEIITQDVNGCLITQTGDKVQIDTPNFIVNASNNINLTAANDQMIIAGGNIKVEASLINLN